jgi:hypothetical protein
MCDPDMKRKVAKMDEPGHEDMLGYPKLAVPVVSLLDELDRCPSELRPAVEAMFRVPPAPLPEQVMYKPFFDLVAPKDNWKNPIDCKIDAPTDETDRNLFKLMITRAVAFYAGSCATITDDGKQIVVKARGYYADVGA